MSWSEGTKLIWTQKSGEVIKGVIERFDVQKDYSLVIVMRSNDNRLYSIPQGENIREDTEVENTEVNTN